MFANGNNASVAGDMVRRTIRCGLDANLEHPETRAFKRNPLNLVQQNRGKYIAAALTIPLAYLAARRPNPLPPLVSFEEWSTLVREPLVWLGCPDPLKTQDALRTEDPSKLTKAAVFDAWTNRIGLGTSRAATTKEIIHMATDDEPLHDALLTVATQRFADRQIDPKTLGKWLSSQLGTIAAGTKLCVNRVDKAKPKRYLELHGDR
jgi:putative DNA primase/helicase